VFSKQVFQYFYHYSGYYQIRNIGDIQANITVVVCKTLARALVKSCFGYSYSLLFDLTQAIM